MAGRALLESDHGFPDPSRLLTENGVQVEPVQHFIVDLENFLSEKGYEITAAYPSDVELRESGTGKLIGYWPSKIDVESFRWLK